jgi:hypothetical protein
LNASTGNEIVRPCDIKKGWSIILRDGTLAVVEDSKTGKESRLITRKYSWGNLTGESIIQDWCKVCKNGKWVYIDHSPKERRKYVRRTKGSDEEV